MVIFWLLSAAVLSEDDTGDVVHPAAAEATIIKIKNTLIHLVMHEPVDFHRAGEKRFWYSTNTYW
jgi:hypothetical protein